MVQSPHVSSIVKELLAIEDQAEQRLKELENLK